MAKGNKPTVSAGIFNPGLNSGKSQGPTPSERKADYNTPISGSPGNAKSRMVIEATNKYNPVVLRKPK